MFSLQKLASLFLKFAQVDFSSPELSWVPEEFKEAKPFKKYPLQNIVKKFHEFGIADFREEVKISFREESAEKLIFLMIQNLKDIAKEISEEIVLLSTVNSEENEEATSAYEKHVALRDFIISIYVLAQDKIDLFLNEGSLKLFSNWVPPKKLGWRTFPAGSNLIKTYNTLLSKIKKTITLNIDQYFLEKTQEYKEYLSSAKSNSLQVVFSTKINDLIGISSRGIRSCQSLFCEKEEDVDVNNFSKKIVGTVLSQYIGVIYLTTGSDFIGRGERMFSRCLVRLLYNIKEEKFYVFIDKMYPKENEEYRAIFFESLKKRSSIFVIKSKLDFKSVSQDFNPENEISPNEFIHPVEDENIDEEYLPYQDITFNTSIKKLYQGLEPGASYNDKKKAILNLPVSMIEKYIYDDDDRIPLFVASRLPQEKLKEYVNHENYQVREIASAKLGKDFPELFFKSEENNVIKNVLYNLHNKERVNIFLNSIKNPENFSQDFIQAFTKTMQFPFVIQNINYFDQSQLLYFFTAYMGGGQFKWAAEFLSKLIANGQASTASDVFEKYLDEEQIDNYELQKLFDLLSIDMVVKLMNASLTKTVLEIFRYGLTIKKVQEFVESISIDEIKNVLRFDKIYDEFFAKNYFVSYPGRVQKIYLLKEKLGLDN